MHRFRYSALAVTLFLIGSGMNGPFAPDAWGQDDLFGGFDDFPGGDAGGFPMGLVEGDAEGLADGDSQPKASSEEEPEIPEPPSPVVEQLLLKAARDTNSLADSIAALARLERWQDVDQLIRKLNNQKLTAAAQADAAKRIGPVQFLRIRSEASISDASRATLAKIAEAAIAQRQNPDQLTAAVSALHASSVDVRGKAARKLFAGGNAAIAVLAKAMVEEQDDTRLNRLSSLMQRMGDHAFEPLQQAALYGTPSLRSGALSALAAYRPEQQVQEFLTALHAVDATDEEQKLAMKVCNAVLGQVPTQQATVAALTSEFQAFRRAALKMPNDGQTSLVWSFDPSSEQFAWTESSRIAVAYRDVVDAGARLQRLADRDSIRDRLAAQLAYRIVIDPDWFPGQELDPLKASLGPHLNAQLLLSTLRSAMERGDHAATLGLVRWIAADSSP